MWEILAEKRQGFFVSWIGLFHPLFMAEKPPLTVQSQDIAIKCTVMDGFTKLIRVLLWYAILH